MHNNDYYYKCQEYQEAIDILDNNETKTNDAKVHLAYYACFLYMKHLINLFFKEERLINQTRFKVQTFYKNKKVKGGGSHLALFLMFRNFIAYAKVYNEQEQIDLNNDLEELKIARTSASYAPKQVSDDLVEETLDRMDDVIADFKELEAEIKYCLNNGDFKKFSWCKHISKQKWVFNISYNQSISFKPI